MNKILSITLWLGLFLLTAATLQAQQSSVSVKITGSVNKEATFTSGIVSRQLIAYTELKPENTLGFFTDRNPTNPFYFAAVMADLVYPLAVGDFPMLQVVNDMPQLGPSTLKGALLSIKMNDKNIAKPDEYISIPGSNHLISIQQINSSEIKGTFSSKMQCVSDASKQIQVSGSFVLKR